jgi:dipeptidyl aminopeptidase/acylaminoacyl peptidase
MRQTAWPFKGGSVFSADRARERITLAILLFLCASAVPRKETFGEELQAPLPIDDVIDMVYWAGVRSVSLSPDGNWAAYAVRTRERPVSAPDCFYRSGVPSSGVGSDIYVVDLRTGRSENITAGRGSNFLPSWSPDSQSLAFASDRDGTGARLWVWTVKDRKARKVSETDLRTSQIEWTADSRSLVVAARPQGFSLEEYVQKASGSVSPNAAAAQAESAVRVFRGGASSGGEKTGSLAGPWNLDYYVADLALVDAITGRSKILVSGDRITKFQVSPDGRWVAYSSPVQFERTGSQQILYNLVVLDTQTGRTLTAAPSVRLILGSQFSWSPRGNRLAYRMYGPEEQTGDCFVADLVSGVIRNVTHLPKGHKLPMHVDGTPLWDREGRKLYFILDNQLWRSDVSEETSQPVGRPRGRDVVELLQQSNQLFQPEGRDVAVVVTHDDDQKEDGFWETNLDTGKSKMLLEHGECYRCSASMGNGFISMAQSAPLVGYIAQDAAHPPDLWVSEPDFLHPRRASHLNPRLEKYKMGAARVIDWRSNEGQPLRGALLLPSEYNPGQRYPLIVLVYGGEFGSNSVTLFGGLERGMPQMNIQLLATRGYAVLVPDVPQRLTTPMADIASAVLPGINRVIELGIADPERLGVIGHSYGGYSVLSLLVQTKRFRAAVESAGYADLLGNYGEMDDNGSAFGVTIEETGQGLMGGPPWEYPQRYLQNSPIFYLDRIETPLLMVHGSKDTTVATFLGDEVFVGLRRLGRTVEYRKYLGEGHSPDAAANGKDVARRTIEWFDMYLKPAAGKPANTGSVGE